MFCFCPSGDPCPHQVTNAKSGEKKSRIRPRSCPIHALSLYVVSATLGMNKLDLTLKNEFSLFRSQERPYDEEGGGTENGRDF